MKPVPGKARDREGEGMEENRSVDFAAGFQRVAGELLLSPENQSGRLFQRSVFSLEHSEGTPPPV